MNREDHYRCPHLLKKATNTLPQRNKWLWFTLSPPARCLRDKVFLITVDLGPWKWSAERMAGWIRKVSIFQPGKHAWITDLRALSRVQVSVLQSLSGAAVALQWRRDRLGCEAQTTDCTQGDLILSVLYLEFYFSKMFLLLKENNNLRTILWNRLFDSPH